MKKTYKHLKDSATNISSEDLSIVPAPTSNSKIGCLLLNLETDGWTLKSPDTQHAYCTNVTSVVAVNGVLFSSPWVVLRIKLLREGFLLIEVQNKHEKYIQMDKYTNCNFESEEIYIKKIKSTQHHLNLTTFQQLN
jgi:hypothetical protein